MSHPLISYDAVVLLLLLLVVAAPLSATRHASAICDQVPSIEGPGTTPFLDNIFLGKCYDFLGTELCQSSWDAFAGLVASRPPFAFDWQRFWVRDSDHCLALVCYSSRVLLICISPCSMC